MELLLRQLEEKSTEVLTLRQEHSKALISLQAELSHALEEVKKQSIYIYLFIFFLKNTEILCHYFFNLINLHMINYLNVFVHVQYFEYLSFCLFHIVLHKIDVMRR